LRTASRPLTSAEIAAVVMQAKGMPPGDAAFKEIVAVPAEQSALRDKMRAQYSNPKVQPAAPLVPQMFEAGYQRPLDENRERVSVTPEVPKPAAAAPIPKPVAPPPVADTHLGADKDTEAGKDW
jgi:hypothetical protein